MTVTWSLRRNTDQALPASHTIEIMFNLPPDFPGGGIANVPGVLMKQSEQARGMPLAGLAVKVTNGFFLIGLSAVDADVQRNIQLLKDRPWFDIPIVYNNGGRAILALEKGPPGDEPSPMPSPPGRNNVGSLRRIARGRCRSWSCRVGTPAKMSSSDAKKPKPAVESHIASALRTLDTEAEGIAALVAAMSDGLGASFVAAVETIRARAAGSSSPAWASPATSRARSPRRSLRPARRHFSCTPPTPAMATSA